MVDLLNPKFSQSQSEALEKLPEKEVHIPLPARRFERIRVWFLGRSRRRVFVRLALAFLATLVLIYLFVIHPAVAVYTKAMNMKEPINRLQTALNQGNLVLAGESLRQVEAELSELKDQYRRLGHLRLIPLINNYYGDGKHLLEAASFSLDGGRVLLDSLTPFSDVLGLTEGFGRYLTTEQQVVSLAGILPQIASQVDVALGRLFLVRVELEQVDPSRYPTDIRGIKLRFWLGEIQKMFSDFEPLLVEAKSIIETLPHLLGTPERNYLVIFQNDAELRATGGFITYYGLITLRGGKIIDSNFAAGAMIHKNQPYEKPPEPIRKYLGVRTWHLQDSNFSPDFLSSSTTLVGMWKRSKLPSIAGIIAITTESAGKLLGLTGPIRIAGYDLDLTDANLPDDCRTGGLSFTSTNLVCRLEYYVEKHAEGGTEKRKVILGKLSEAVIKRITSSSAEIWPQLLDLTFNLLDQKDILLYSTDKEEQELIERLGYAGRIKDYDGDYLHISDSNFGGKKTDLYMQETVEQSLTKLEDGTWRKTVKIHYYNPQPYDNWLSAIYRDWVRLYVPRGSKLVKIEGAREEWGSWGELGKTVFGAFFTLWPQKKHTLTFVYDLPEGVVGEEYQLLMQKQPGTNITLVKVKIGAKIESFELKTDCEITVDY